MTITDNEDADRCKGRLLVRGDEVRVVCSELRKMGGIWHGWMYNASVGRGEALGWMPLNLFTIQPECTTSN